MSVLGGDDVGVATRRVMSRVIGHQLALQMNWIGGLNKESFATYPDVIRLITSKFLNLYLSSSNLIFISVYKIFKSKHMYILHKKRIKIY